MSLTHFNHRFNLVHQIHQNHQNYQIHGYFKLVILICMLLSCEFNCVRSAPVNTDGSSSSDPNQSLKQYLKEPEIIKINKEKIVLRVFPLLKKDVQVSNYYIVVEPLDPVNPFVQRNTSIQIDNVDFSLNYYNSLKKGSPFYASVKLSAQIFYARRTYVTVIIGKHQIDLTRPREFGIDYYVNPLLVCGNHYRIGVAAELKTNNNKKKEFIYVPFSRTIIMNENGTCSTVDTIALFLTLSSCALLISLISFCILLTYNTVSTGNLYFWKRKKMNCKKLLKANSNYKECLTLINHTNIYEDADDKGDYNEISIGKSKMKNFEAKSNPIPISNLFEYYNQMNADHLFKKEYESIPKGRVFNWKVATLKINQKKNRYLNLLPYDMNRVVLKPFPNEDFILSKSFSLKSLKKNELDNIHLKPTDYINASYIDVLDSEGKLIPKRYISTQGPLKHTISDFWKMIYQTNAYQIIMLANVYEGGQVKCEKYWPDYEQSEVYGQLLVTCKDEFNYADYVIRIFRIELKDDQLNNNSKAGREVTQYHFTQWKDHSVPEYSDSIGLLLSCIRTHWSYENYQHSNDNNEAIRDLKYEIELEDKQKSSPVVVHCSAGIGRTISFVLIDSLIEQAYKVKKENGDFENFKIDVLKQFANLRKQRIQGIERVSQYAFVHQVLMELLCSRDVNDIEPQNYTDYYKFLKESSTKQVSEHKNISKLEQQFNILNKFRVKIDDNLKSVGMFNLKKNRNRQSIPKNTTRVLLPVVDNDYINAVYLNGFKSKFIVTEVPLKEMRFQFWQMINSESIDTIVALNSIESHDIYWPTELNNSHVYKELEIELMSEEKTQDYYVKRLFRINKKKLIYQLHYNHWDSIIKRPTNLASYCLFMKAIQMHLNKSSLFPSQFVVQCTNGVMASGIYCTTKHICDRLFAENRINIFLSTKYIRTNRPEFIESLEQYNFLFEYIQLIVLSFYSKDFNLCFSMNN